MGGDTMAQEARQGARLRLVAGLQAGLPWREAATAAATRTSRATAFRLLRAVRDGGEAAALADGRHGHPSKFRQPVKDWLLAYCGEHPGATSRTVQAALQERFGVTVSRSQLNRVRAALGVRQRPQGAGGKYAAGDGGCAG